MYLFGITLIITPSQAKSTDLLVLTDNCVVYMLNNYNYP